MAVNQINVVINGKNLASAALKMAKKEIYEVGTASVSTSASMGGLSTAMSKTAKIGLASALAAMSAGILAFGKAVKESSKIELATSEFTVLTGSMQLATSTIKELQDVAAKTPLSFQDMTTGAKTLLASGSAVADIKNEMLMLGDVAMGNSDKLQTLSEAYSKVQSRGRASMRELNSFTYAGVPIMAKLAGNLGVTTEALTKLVESGKIGFKDVKEAIISMTTAGGQFNGMMEKQSQTLSGRWSTFKDDMTIAFADLGQKILPDVKNALEDIMTSFQNLLTNPGFVGFINSSVNFVSWLLSRLPDIWAYLQFGWAVLSIIGEEISTIWTKLENLPVIGVTFKTIGDTFEAIKRGFKTGDWSDLFGIKGDIFKAGIAIAATLMLGSLTKTAVQKVLQGAGFTTGNVIAGAMAGLTIGIMFKEAMTDGNWASFAADMIAGLIAGLAVGGLTGSFSAGVLTFTIVANLKLGSGILGLGDKPKPAVLPASAYESLNNFTSLNTGPLPDFNSINTDSFGSGKKTGEAVSDGFKAGIGELDKLGIETSTDFLNGVKSNLGIHSPSTVMKDIGKNIKLGLEEGIGTDPAVIPVRTMPYMSVENFSGGTEGSVQASTADSISEGTFLSKILQAWNELQAQLDANHAAAAEKTKIWDDGTSSSGTSDAGKTGFRDSLLQNLGKFGSGLLDSLQSLSLVKQIMDPLSVIIEGVFDILEPLINDILSPIIGILKILGQTIGKILAPVFEALAPVIEKITEGFIWLYNSAIVPIANGLITVFNIVANGIIGIANGVIDVLNWIPGVNIDRVAYRDLNSGHLEKISQADIDQASSNSSSSSTGSSSSAQSTSVTVYQTIEGNVIGDGGLAKLGEYLVKAIEAYAGAGGKIKFLKAGS